MVIHKQLHRVVFNYGLSRLNTRNSGEKKKEKKLSHALMSQKMTTCKSSSKLLTLTKEIMSFLNVTIFNNFVHCLFSKYLSLS